MNFSEVYRRADQLAHMLSPESHPTFAINLVNMLSQWMVWFPSDFRDESMINRSKQMVIFFNKVYNVYFIVYNSPSYQLFVYFIGEINHNLASCI